MDPHPSYTNEECTPITAELLRSYIEPSDRPLHMGADVQKKAFKEN